MQSVVGVFDSIEQARRARETLLDAGFDETAVHIESQQQMLGDENRDEGFMASVGNFFSKLFGDEDEHAGHYAEAVRQGSAVVVVTVADESKVAGARSALAAAGAVDLEKRVKSWQDQGYAKLDKTIDSGPVPAETVDDTVPAVVRKAL